VSGVELRIAEARSRIAGKEGNADRTGEFVSVPTRHRARAIAWYRDVLGLQVSADAAGEAEAPGLTLSFGVPKEGGEMFVPNESGIAFRVADVDAVEEVRGSGGNVIGVEDTGVCKMGFVRDPDGNVVIFYPRYAEEPDE
jgi:catechol 2,3-dioxygenase-like lactoylglutathione lyase family enzyme